MSSECSLRPGIFREIGEKQNYCLGLGQCSGSQASPGDRGKDNASILSFSQPPGSDAVIEIDGVLSVLLTA